MPRRENMPKTKRPPIVPAALVVDQHGGRSTPMPPKAILANLTDAWVRLVEDCRLKRYQRPVIDPKTGKLEIVDASESLDLSAHVVFDLTRITGACSFRADGNGNEQLRSMVTNSITARLPMPYSRCSVIIDQSAIKGFDPGFHRQQLMVGVFDRVDESTVALAQFVTDGRLKRPWTASPLYAELRCPPDDTLHVAVADDAISAIDADGLSNYLQFVFAQFWAILNAPKGEMVYAPGGREATRSNSRRERLNLPLVEPVRSIRVIHLSPQPQYVRTPQGPTGAREMTFATPAWSVRSHMRRRPKSGGYAVIPPHTRRRQGLEGEPEPPWYEVRS